MRVAMVCLGNICRSPMAEAVARAMVDEAGLAGQVEVVSYGTAGYHEGESADPGAVAALRRRGWPVLDHRARRLRADDVAAADLIACADQANRRAVLDLAGPEAASKVVLLRSFGRAGGAGDQADRAGAGGGTDVPDPYAGGPDAFDRSLALIERACRGLVTELAAARR